MNRIIRLEVRNEFIRGAGQVIGAAGSHDDVELELSFSPVWAGTAKKIVWFDALGENAVVTALGTDKLVPGETETYRVSVPHEAKAVEGDMRLTIRGVNVKNGVESRAVVAATASFPVLPAIWDPLAEESTDVPPTQADQLRQEIEAIKSDIVDAAKAADALEETLAAQAAAETAKAGAETARAWAETARTEAAEYARTARQYSGKPPVIQNGTWWTWNADAGKYTDTGRKARGENGSDGRSAYQYAVDGGYAGTEEQFRALMGTGPWLPLSGGTLAGPLAIRAPTEDSHAATKDYVDRAVSGADGLEVRIVQLNSIWKVTSCVRTVFEPLSNGMKFRANYTGVIGPDTCEILIVPPEGLAFTERSWSGTILIGGQPDAYAPGYILPSGAVCFSSGRFSGTGTSFTFVTAEGESAVLAVEKAEVLTQTLTDERYLKLSGGTVTGPLSVPAPTADAHAATKGYVDSAAEAKQDKLTGTRGQVLGFGADGGAAAIPGFKMIYDAETGVLKIGGAT